MNSQEPNTDNQNYISVRPFGFEPEPVPEPASIGSKISAVLFATIYLGINLYGPINEHASPFVTIRLALILLVFPSIAVVISQTLYSYRTQKAKFKVFMIASVVCALATLAWHTVPHHYVMSVLGPDKSKWTAQQFRDEATQCLSNRDFDCAQDDWTEYVRLRPLDGQGLANLGIVMNMRDAHADAVIQFKKAIETGEGAYDLFAYYADSLEKLGQIEEAIDWNYRALSVYPTLVDVRGRLATLLVHQKRHHEALALLQTFDNEAIARRQLPYFAAQRVSIENLIADEPPTDSGKIQSIRLPIENDHYFVTVKIGEAHPELFVVDTGATHTTVNQNILATSKVKFRVRDPHVTMITADGRHIAAQAVTIDSLHVGPFALKNVSAVVCDGCISLLGQTTLSNFNMQSSRTKGVEFLTLTKR